MASLAQAARLQHRLRRQMAPGPGLGDERRRRRTPKADNVDWDKPVTHGPQSLGFDYSYIIPASLDMDPYCWLENGRVVEAATSHTPGSKRRWDGGDGFWRAGPMAPSFDFYGVLPTVTDQVDRTSSNARRRTALLSLCPAHRPAHALDADERVPGQDEGRLVRRFRRPGGLAPWGRSSGGGGRRVQGQHAGHRHVGQRLALAGRPDREVRPPGQRPLAGTEVRHPRRRATACRSCAAGPAGSSPARRAARRSA